MDTLKLKIIAKCNQMQNIPRYKCVSMCVNMFVIMQNLMKKNNFNVRK